MSSQQHPVHIWDPFKMEDGYEENKMNCLGLAGDPTLDWYLEKNITDYLTREKINCIYLFIFISYI